MHSMETSLIVKNDIMLIGMNENENKLLNYDFNMQCSYLVRHGW